jgi:hypothetical protein
LHQPRTRRKTDDRQSVQVYLPGFQMPPGAPLFTSHPACSSCRYANLGVEAGEAFAQALIQLPQLRTLNLKCVRAGNRY